MDGSKWVNRSQKWQALGCFCVVLMSLAASAHAQSPVGAVLVVPRSSQADEDLIRSLNNSLVVSLLYRNDNSAVAAYSFALSGRFTTDKIQVRVPTGWLGALTGLNTITGLNTKPFDVVTSASDTTVVSVSTHSQTFISGPAGTAFYLIPLGQWDAFIRVNRNKWPDWQNPVHLTQDMTLVAYNPPNGSGILLTDNSGFDARYLNPGVATTNVVYNVVETPTPVPNQNTPPPTGLSFFRLTDSFPGESGAAWFPDKQYVAGGFVTTFQFQMANLGSLRSDVTPGGDGFAFVIQDFDLSPLGPFGGFLGYHGIPNSLAVEFDTYWNQEPGFGDPDGNHISVHTRGTAPNSVSESASIGRTPTGSLPNLHDGARHLVQILYQPGALSIFLDDLQFPVLVVNRGPDGSPLELTRLLGLPDGRAWWGFTAGTGAAYQTHDIFSWDFRTFANGPF
jgi:hypothetical protein